MMTKKRRMNEESLKNLKKGKQFSKDYQPTPEAKSQGQKNAKTMRETLEILLAKEITNKAGETATTREAISVSLIKKAMSGDVRAFEVIRDTIGEKPTDKIDATNTNIDITDQKVIENVINKIKDL